MKSRKLLCLAVVLSSLVWVGGASASAIEGASVAPTVSRAGFLAAGLESSTNVGAGPGFRQSPYRPLSTGHEQLYVGLSCDGAGFIKQYTGNAVDMSRNTVVETYFNFQFPSGTVSYSHSVSHLRSSNTGSLTTPTYGFVQSTYVAVQFNIYYAYPDDNLFQSQWRYCGGGPALADHLGQ